MKFELSNEEAELVRKSVVYLLANSAEAEEVFDELLPERVTRDLLFKFTPQGESNGR